LVDNEFDLQTVYQQKNMKGSISGMLPVSNDSTLNQQHQSMQIQSCGIKKEEKTT